MIFEGSYYSAILFLAAATLGALALYVWKRRSVPGGTYFSLLMALMAGWVLVSALEYSTADIDAKLIFAKLAFAGGVSIPPLWLLFSLEYCYPNRRIDRRLNALLWVLPWIAAVLTMTNEYHGLIWSSITPADTWYGDTLIYTRGPAAWAVTLYSFAIATPGFLLLFWKALHSGEKNHQWPISLLLGAVIVLLLSGASQYILIAGYGIDLTPLALAIMGIVFAWGVFRHRIFELLPVAAEKLIENMADGVLVLNKSGAIVKINAAARREMGVTEAVVGQPAEKALSDWPLLAECLKNKGGKPSEIIINSGDGRRPRWIDARVSHLQDEHAGPLGTLIILRDITEHKLYEETLRKSEKDRTKAEQLANIGYYDWDLKMLEAQISAGCTRIFGFPEGTGHITYEMYTDRIHPEDIERIKSEVHNSVWQGKTLSMDYRIVRPDGTVRYVHSESEAAVRDATGAYARQFGVVQDITERKLSEVSLRKSEHDRIKAERLANLGYYYWDIEKREAHISEGCVRILGLPAGTPTISWADFLDRIHPEDRERAGNEVVTGLRRDSPHALEVRIVVPDGTVRYVSTESEATIRDPASGRLVQFGIIQDITERRQAEEAVRQTEEKYRTIVETANESICIVDNQARLAFINSKAADMLGYTVEEMQGHSVYEFVDPEYHQELSKNLVTKRLGAKEQTNYKMRCKNGDVIWALSSSSPLYDDKGEITGLLVMLTDITDLKLADEQLIASLKEKEALLKEVHHRVKNNLQIITSLLNLQSVGVEDPRYLEMIRDSQNRIKSMALVHELLYKSKDLSNIDISEYLHSLILNISRSYSHTSGNVALRTEIEKIDMDIDKAVPVGIIVTELVSNAYKYAFPEGRAGEISVELRRDEGKIVLTISDNGVGLPEGFEIEKTGTLGLQLVEMLTEQIEGKLEIEGGGLTVFRISIPG